MGTEIQQWKPSTGLSLEQKVQKSREMISLSTSPRAALEAAKQLIGQWPHAKPADPEVYAGSLAAVLAQYPLGLVNECCDPRVGLARDREFPPTVACIVEWCDARLKHHQLMAAYRPPALPKHVEPEYDDNHRQGMLARLQDLVHSLITGKKHQKWQRPIGRFEKAGDQWTPRAAAVTKPHVAREWRPHTADELRAMYGGAQASEAAE